MSSISVVRTAPSVETESAARKPASVAHVEAAAIAPQNEDMGALSTRLEWEAAVLGRAPRPMSERQILTAQGKAIATASLASEAHGAPLSSAESQAIALAARVRLATREAQGQARYGLGLFGLRTLRAAGKL